MLGDVLVGDARGGCARPRGRAGRVRSERSITPAPGGTGTSRPTAAIFSPSTSDRPGSSSTVPLLGIDEAAGADGGHLRHGRRWRESRRGKPGRGASSWVPSPLVVGRRDRDLRGWRSTPGGASFDGQRTWPLACDRMGTAKPRPARRNGSPGTTSASSASGSGISISPCPEGFLARASRPSSVGAPGRGSRLPAALLALRRVVHAGRRVRHRRSPFYLAHPRLMRLELAPDAGGGRRNQRLGACGSCVTRPGTRWRTPIVSGDATVRRQPFGRTSKPYPDSLFAQALQPELRDPPRLAWYAQSHPDEDFAESLRGLAQARVRLERQRYAGWPALAEAPLRRRGDARLRGRPPLVTTRRAVDPLSISGATFARTAAACRAHYRVDGPGRLRCRPAAALPRGAGGGVPERGRFLQRIRRESRPAGAALHRTAPLPDRPGPRRHDRARPPARACTSPRPTSRCGPSSTSSSTRRTS